MLPQIADALDRHTGALGDVVLKNLPNCPRTELTRWQSSASVGRTNARRPKRSRVRRGKTGSVGTASFGHRSAPQARLRVVAQSNIFGNHAAVAQALRSRNAGTRLVSASCLAISFPRRSRHHGTPARAIDGMWAEQDTHAKVAEIASRRFSDELPANPEVDS